MSLNVAGPIILNCSLAGVQKEWRQDTARRVLFVRGCTGVVWVLITLYHGTDNNGRTSLRLKCNCFFLSCWLSWPGPSRLWTEGNQFYFRFMCWDHKEKLLHGTRGKIDITLTANPALRKSHP